MLYSPTFDSIPSRKPLNGLNTSGLLDNNSHSSRSLAGRQQTRRSCRASGITQRTTQHLTSGITEVILPEGDDLSIVLPSLAYLTHHHQDRWLTWISLKPKIDRHLLQAYNFDLSHVRVVYPKSSEEAFWLFWEALTEGNSHTVIGTLGGLESRSLTKLEHAATAGRCMGMVLRSRNSGSH